jgi:hypothetical protein
MIHRFVFTGLIHLLWPETRLQIWCGVLASVCVYGHLTLD